MELFTNAKAFYDEYYSTIYAQEDDNIDEDVLLYLIFMENPHTFKYIMYIKTSNNTINFINVKYLVYATCGTKRPLIYGMNNMNHFQYNSDILIYKYDPFVVNSYNGKIYHIRYKSVKHINIFRVNFNLFGKVVYSTSDKIPNSLFRRILKNIKITGYNCPKSLYKLRGC